MGDIMCASPIKYVPRCFANQMDWRIKAKQSESGDKILACHGIIQRVGARLFAQFVAVSTDNDGKVRIGRVRKLQQGLQVALAGSGIKQIDSAYDVGDSLRSIVNHAGQLVGH